MLTNCETPWNTRKREEEREFTISYVLQWHAANTLAQVHDVRSQQENRGTDMGNLWHTSHFYWVAAASQLHVQEQPAIPISFLLTLLHTHIHQE